MINKMKLKAPDPDWSRIRAIMQRSITDARLRLGLADCYSYSDLPEALKPLADEVIAEYYGEK